MLGRMVGLTQVFGDFFRLGTVRRLQTGSLQMRPREVASAVSIPRSVLRSTRILHGIQMLSSRR